MNKILTLKLELGSSELNLTRYCCLLWAVAEAESPESKEKPVYHYTNVDIFLIFKKILSICFKWTTFFFVFTKFVTILLLFPVLFFWP